MTETEIVTKVLSILNEIGESAALTLLTEDTVKIEEYIKSVIPDAVDLAILNSPNRCVNRKSSPSVTVTVSDGCSIISKPSDYVSLIALQLNGWKRIVTKAYDIGSESYKHQKNTYTRSGVNKPTVFNSYSSSGDILECYPSESSLSLFVYEGKYSSTDGLSLDAGDPIAIAICYLCASLVYSIFENPNTAKEMKGIAINLLNAANNVSD